MTTTPQEPDTNDPEVAPSGEPDMDPGAPSPDPDVVPAGQPTDPSTGPTADPSAPDPDADGTKGP
jgi:hypothetical protein